MTMSSQPTEPESGSGAPTGAGQAVDVPQAAPTVGAGPDNQMLPKSFQPQGEAETVPKKQHDGLMAKYQSEKAAWEAGFAELTARLDKLTSTQPAEAASPAPGASQPSKPAQTSTPEMDPLDRAIQQRKALNYRDMLVETVAKELGLPALAMFSDDIPVHAPTIGADGQIDDSAQRAAITAFADKLRGVQGAASTATRDALIEGMTPGSAPGSTPAGDGGDELYQEFLELLQAQATTEFSKLPAADQRRAEQRYLELLDMDEIKDRHEGATTPTMSWQDMQKTVRDLMKSVGSLQGRGRTPHANMA